MDDPNKERENDATSGNTPDMNYELKPFVHQVGGHAGLFQINDEIVCKPTTSREWEFYQKLPATFLDFSPAFKGVIEIDLSRLEETDDKSSTSSSNSESEQIHVFLDKNSQSHGGNPWGVKCQTSTLARMLKSNKRRHSFILIENLVWKYQRPCILDLKLGTQQHGDDASEQKKISQIRKCQKTTSSALGVRICGMQIFDTQTNTYNCIDKYQGRIMSNQDFADHVEQFIFAGGGENLISQYLTHLETLIKLVEAAEGFRFYSSSLLLVYEGYTSVEGSPPCSVKMIDFEHSTFRGYRADPYHSGPDTGYCTGLRTLIALLRELREP